MYERFTEPAKKAIELGNQEAQQFNHEYIGTEHLLLGLSKVGRGVAATVLNNLDIDLKNLRLEVEKIVKRGPDRVIGKLPMTPRLKEVLFNYAIKEARALDHKWLCTGHLLLALHTETGGIGYEILKALGLIGETFRQKILDMIAGKQVDENEHLAPRTVSPEEQQEQWQSKIPLTLLIDPGNASAEELSLLFLEISTLYRMVGGSGVNFTIVDAKEPALA